jgi:hypothetical protein
VLLEDVVVRSGARVVKAILDEGVEVAGGVTVGGRAATSAIVGHRATRSTQDVPAGRRAAPRSTDRELERQVLSISVTSAAIGERSDRVSVTWANSGWPLSASMTAATPSCRPTRRLSRCATSWVSTTREPCPRPGQHREQHAALERLRLVDDDERVVQRAAADVRQRQDLEQPARHDLLDDLGRDERAERVEDACAHGPIFSALSPGR